MVRREGWVGRCFVRGRSTILDQRPSEAEVRVMVEAFIVILARERLIFGVIGEEGGKFTERCRIETGGIILEKVAQFTTSDPPALLSHRRRHPTLPRLPICRHF